MGFVSAIHNHSVIAAALGSRLTASGSERTVHSATLVDGNGKRNVTITTELPGKLRIDDPGQQGKALTFDGNNGASNKGPASADDNDLLELLSYDTQDGFLSAVANGAALRLIGGNFRTDDGKAANYTGPWLEVYQVIFPAASRSDKSIRAKFYMFDSSTHLLNRVGYDAVGGSTRVEVVYGPWQTVQGIPVPGKLTRFENGVKKQEVEVSTATFSKGASDNAFTKP